MRYFFKSLIVVCLALSSCYEQVETNPGNQSLSNVARFSSNEQFMEASTLIPSMSEVQFGEWEKEKAFVSYRSVFQQATKDWEPLATDKERAEFLDKNKDILFLQDSVLVPKIDIALYQSIANREGIYETNGFVNKIIGDYIVTVRADQYSKLKLINEVGQLSSKAFRESGIRLTKFAGSSGEDNSRVDAACSTFLQGSYFDNHSKCRDDREVFISARSYILLSTSGSGDLRQPRVEFKVWARIRNWLCNWSQYYTQLEYRNVSFSIMAWSSTGQPTLYNMNLPNYAPSGDRWDLPWDQPIGSPLLNQVINPNPFTYVHAEGSSRGVGNNWAILNCP